MLGRIMESLGREGPEAQQSAFFVPSEDRLIKPAHTNRPRIFHVLWSACMLFLWSCGNSVQYTKGGATEYDLARDQFECESPEFGTGKHAQTGAQWE